MARPIKDGVDYFPLDVVMDDKINLIEAEFGLTGFALVVKLYQKIYGGRGYYCEYTNEVALLFSRQCALGGSVVSEIVSASIKRGIFDKNLFDKYQILTSRGIQKRYFEAVSRRKQINVIPQYLLVDVAQIIENVNINLINVVNNPVNDSNNSQSKGKESKVNKSKEGGETCKLIADMFNETCVSLPRLTVMSDKRKKDIKARLNKYSVEDFKKVFELAEASDFLKGDNARNWAASFDWLITDSNMAKVLEGNYKNKGKTAKKNAFNNYSQGTYDFDEYEKQERERRKKYLEE